MSDREPVATFIEPDYAYGNHGPLELIRVVPNIGQLVIDAHESLDYTPPEKSPYTDEQVLEKVGELRDHYKIIGDPASSKHFGVAILNADLPSYVPAILMVTTDSSNFYNEEMKPNNAGNAIELAYLALSQPGRRIIAIESPGTGNSSNLTGDEYRQAGENGRLMEAAITGDGMLRDFTVFETIDAIVRALSSEGLDNISHISTKAASVLYATAIASSLQANVLERSFLYNPTNISDHNAAALMIKRGLGVFLQGKYKKMSHDPLRISKELEKEAEKIMSDQPKRKVDLARSSAHNPLNMINKNRMFARGNQRGEAAAVHVAAVALHHPDAKQTIVLPEFAPVYKRPEDFRNFINGVFRLLGSQIEIDEDEIKTLQLPLGEYGHSHYPTVYQTLEDHAFNR